MMSPALRRQLARALAPVFLLTALLTGGATLEGEPVQALLFTASALLIAGLCIFSEGWIRGAVITLLCFATGLVLLGLAQIIPIDAALIAGLPDRDRAGASLAALGLGPGPQTLSLTPEASLASLLAFLAPLAGFCVIAAIKWSRGAGLLKWVIPLLGAAGACLGLAQILLGKEIPGLFFYSFTTRDFAVGVFSNPNHQASFLLMCLPFVGVIVSDLRRDWEGSDADSARAALAGVIGLLLVTGILTAGSAAGYILLVPVSLLTGLIAFAGRQQTTATRRAGWATLPLIFVFAGLVVFSSPRLSGLGYTSFEDGPASRIGINRVSAEMAAIHWEAGTGLGSYEAVFHLYEDPFTVSRTYVAHAHNDYLEWVIETGLAGSLLLVFFLAWWLFHFGRLWIAGAEDSVRLRRAAAAATLVPVLHSLVDYPLRTPGIASLAAVCLAVMVVTRPRTEAIPSPALAEETPEELKTVSL